MVQPRHAKLIISLVRMRVWSPRMVRPWRVKLNVQTAHGFTCSRCAPQPTLSKRAPSERMFHGDHFIQDRCATEPHITHSRRAQGPPPATPGPFYRRQVRHRSHINRDRCAPQPILSKRACHGGHRTRHQAHFIRDVCAPGATRSTTGAPREPAHLNQVSHTGHRIHDTRHGAPFIQDKCATGAI